MNSDLMNAISRLRLTHLSINLYVTPSLTSTPGLIESFSKITHLQCHGLIDSDLGHIIHFTSLTHLAISRSNIAYQPILPVLFSQFPKLRAVVSLDLSSSYDGGVSPVVEESSDLHSDDLRVVRITARLESSVEAWLGDIRYGQGIWGLADEAITRRRREREGAARLGSPLSS
ncbi:hypothetical protein BDN72DRAFT_845152 [Pluteus cervinus]|uniref:Uncharacterized protein n=1 Tax=Pluteus cervinus TaxID=181527 RepID=A0ACD3AJS7_9AGAR|nr:hypothetical protein BDN72DRAFT_845152 [Pluteus cervinus]